MWASLWLSQGLLVAHGVKNSLQRLLALCVNSPAQAWARPMMSVFYCKLRLIRDGFLRWQLLGSQAVSWDRQAQGLSVGSERLLDSRGSYRSENPQGEA